MRKYFIEEKEIDKHCSQDKSVKAGVAERMVFTSKQLKFWNVLDTYYKGKAIQNIF